MMIYYNSQVYLLFLLNLSLAKSWTFLNTENVYCSWGTKYAHQREVKDMGLNTHCGFEVQVTLKFTFTFSYY